MPSILLYLLKANAVLLLFAVTYFGLLRRLTFFTLNRVYLLSALLFAAMYPALPAPALLLAEATPVMFFPVVGNPGAAAALPAATAPAVDWAAVGVALYGAGGAVLLGRLLMQLLSLSRLRRASQPAVVNGLPVRVLPGKISPFSFGSIIYLNPEQHPGPELAAVLRHEQVHVRQWHTVDVLLAQLALAAAWCNPAMWLLRRALLDNLEFLADHAVLKTGLDRRAYQYSLLRLSHAASGLSLVSHFTFPTLKNRVLMMNSPASAAVQAGRYLLALALTLGPAFGFQAVAQGSAKASATGHGPEPVTYYLDGVISDKARVHGVGPENVAHMDVLKDEKARAISGNNSDEYIIAVTTKKNQNSAAVRALSERIAKAAPTLAGNETPAEVNVLTPAALAYITKNYPNSRIIEITKLSYPWTGQVNYKVQLAEGARPHYVFFDEKGSPVKP